MTQERIYWLAWAQIAGVGAVLVRRLEQHFSSLEIAWGAPVQALGQVEGFGSKLLDVIASSRPQIIPQEFLEKHLEKNPCFWTPADADYPKLLLEIPSPPSVLYYRGNSIIKENQGIMPMIAIVGTRQPTEHGRRWTKRLSVALAKGGFTVVSGMAAGIDGEAHRACLKAGGRTIAVVGTGVDIVYPDHHRQLYTEIQQQGLILSEYPAGTTPYKGNFPARNRIIAALSRAVLVIEAPEKSGSLITARYALDFNRDVYTLPNSPDNLQARGCLRLLSQGAGLIMDEGELLEMLGAIPQLPEEEQLSLPVDLPPELAKVLQFVSFSPISFDLLVEETGLNAAAVSSALLQLELMGFVSQLAGMRYQRS